MSESRPPTNLTPLAALPVAVLDLETTGLDVRKDRIVQIGVITMLGSRILPEPRLDERINPGVPIPAVATEIHGLGDADVASARSLPEAIAGLREVLRGRVVVGHHVAFDLAVLRHEAARHGFPWHEPVHLDVGLLLAALEPTLVDFGLEAVTRWLGVHIEGRHSALGDAEAAAEAFSRLVAKLRDADVRTLGEALSFAARRHDLVQQQWHSGWHADPGAPAQPAPESPAPRIDSYVYERCLADVMSSPPIAVGRGETLLEAARRMTSLRIGALLVGEPGRRPEGIVTERDVLRVVAERAVDPARIPVAEAMSSPVESMREEEMLYTALGRMVRLGIRHLAVVDAEGIAIGMVSQRNLLQFRARDALVIGDAVMHAEDAPALASAYGRVPDAAGRLAAEGIGGTEIARVVSGELRAVTARAAELAERGLSERGRPAPAPWCVLVLGSGGRGESMLSSDQDNALIHTGGPEADAWFSEFGAEIAKMLNEAGVPLCNGGVMASNADWRGNVQQWNARVSGWLGRARPEDLLNVDIFFDLIPVGGDRRLAEALQADSVRAASRAPTFLALLTSSIVGLQPLLAAFGRLRVVDGRVDLKRWGTLPIVGLARALALRIDSTERGTQGRLREAAAAGRLGEADAGTLIELHARLMSVILAQQLRDLDEGIRPSSRVAVRSLPREDAKALPGQLRRLEQILQALPEIMSG
jgi:CBS domain-containing protein